MIRLSRLLLAVMIICAASVAVYAQEIYQGEFIQSKYTLYKQPGVLTNISVSNPANMPLPGKTEISFAFTADENGAVEVIVRNGEEETIGAALNIDAEEMTAKCIWHSDAAESLETVSICAGVTYSVTMQLDLEMGSFGAVLYEGREKNKLIGCVLDKALGADILSGGFDGINISGTVSDLEIYRERIAGDKAAVSFYGQSASMGARLAGDIEAGSVIDAYAAAYDEDGRLAALKKQDGVFGGYDDYAEIIFPAGGLFKNTTQLSLFMFEHDSIKPIAKKGTANISEGDAVKTGAIAYTSFADAAAIPKGWAMQAWGGGTAPVYSTGTDESTGTFLKLDAVSTGYRGIRSATNGLPPEGISLSFKVKRSQDYTGNYARIIIIYFDQNGNWKDENGNGYTPTITNIKSLPCDTWKNGIIYISPDNYPAGAVKFQVGFCTAKDSSEEYGGKHRNNLFFGQR
ncbi:MAG: hypothetical protein PUF72_03380 [Clostridiales bacterium]|nr:hypothetical protein [Clostridiales bacterium]